MPYPNEDLPTWAEDPSALVVEPPQAKRDLGWFGSEKPAPMFQNWLSRTAARFIKWLDPLVGDGFFRIEVREDFTGSAIDTGRWLAATSSGSPTLTLNSAEGQSSLIIMHPGAGAWTYLQTTQDLNAVGSAGMASSRVRMGAVVYAPGFGGAGWTANSSFEFGFYNSFASTKNMHIRAQGPTGTIQLIDKNGAVVCDSGVPFVYLGVVDNTFLIDAALIRVGGVDYWSLTVRDSTGGSVTVVSASPASSYNSGQNVYGKAFYFANAGNGASDGNFRWEFLGCFLDRDT